jgi:hypothetical protein
MAGAFARGGCFRPALVSLHSGAFVRCADAGGITARQSA